MNGSFLTPGSSCELHGFSRVQNRNTQLTTHSMSYKSTTAAAILAFAGAAALLPSAAQAAIIYNDGDLILGFRATGGQGASTDYLLDLGNASTILNATTPITFAIGNIGGDLTTIFGSWSTRGDVFWSVSGVQKIAGNGFANNTMFATRSDTIAAPLGTATTTPWTRPSSFGAGTPASKIQSMGLKYGTGTTGNVAGTDQIESASVSGALIQPTSQSNSFASFQPFGLNTSGASAYSYFVDANGIEGNFAAGTLASVLDLYQLTPAAGSLPATFNGNFSISNGGVVTFTPAIPEPSAGLTLTIGAAILGGLRRRNRTVEVES